MKLCHAETFFPATLSPCCNAPLKTGVCTSCAKTAQAPYYFMSTKPIDTEKRESVIRDMEAKLRADLPVGAQIVLALNPLLL